MTLALTLTCLNISKHTPSDSSTSMKMMSALLAGSFSHATVLFTDVVVPTTCMSGKCWVNTRIRLF